MAKKSRAEKFAERAAAEAAALEAAPKRMSKYALKKIAQQNAEKSGVVYQSPGAKAKEAEDLAAEAAKLSALAEDGDAAEQKEAAKARAVARAAKAAIEGATGIEDDQNPNVETKVKTIVRGGKTITIIERIDNDVDVPEKVKQKRIKTAARKQSIRNARKEAFRRLRKVEGRFRRPRLIKGKLNIPIPDKIDFKRTIIETFGVETRDRMPDLYDPQEREASTFKHNRVERMLLSPIKKYLAPIVGKDSLAAYLDRWSRHNDPAGIFKEAFDQIKYIRRHEDGFARVGLPAFLKFVEGISKKNIIDDYAFEHHLFIKRREITGFINTMKAPALRWAKERHPYEASYAFAYFDTYPIHVKLGKRRVICIQLLLIIGVTLDGRKDLLAAIPDMASGRLSVAFWEHILENFKNLGMQNICFVVASARCRYLDLAVSNIFPDATMQYNLLDILQQDSYALPSEFRKKFMADVSDLLASEDFESSRLKLEYIRDKWEPLMEEGHAVLQGNIELLKVHTMLPVEERRIFNSQKTVSSAASLLLGKKGPDDFFSDNAEIMTFLFYRYFLVAKPFWNDHQDEAVFNLSYSRIFTVLRHCDNKGAKLLHRLLSLQHENFMQRHFGSFGNGPVFNLNPARKRIALSGQVGNNTLIASDAAKSEAQESAVEAKTDYSLAARTADDYICASLPGSACSLTEPTTADSALNDENVIDVVGEVVVEEETKVSTKSSKAKTADAAAAQTADADTGVDAGPAKPLSAAEEALENVAVYERSLPSNTDMLDDAGSLLDEEPQTLTLLSATQQAVIPYPTAVAPEATQLSDAENAAVLAAAAEAKYKEREEQRKRECKRPKAKPSRIAQAVFKENRLNFSGSFNGTDLNKLSSDIQIDPCMLISGGTLSPLLDCVDGTFGFISVKTSTHAGSTHRPSVLREAKAAELNAASKAAAEAKAAAIKAEKDAKAAAKALAEDPAYNNFGVAVVSATTLTDEPTAAAASDTAANAEAAAKAAQAAEQAAEAAEASASAAASAEAQADAPAEAAEETAKAPAKKRTTRKTKAAKIAEVEETVEEVKLNGSLELSGAASSSGTLVLENAASSVKTELKLESIASLGITPVAKEAAAEVAESDNGDKKPAKKTRTSKAAKAKAEAAALAEAKAKEEAAKNNIEAAIAHDEEQGDATEEARAKKDNFVTSGAQDIATYERVYEAVPHTDYALGQQTHTESPSVSYTVDNDKGSGAVITPNVATASQESGLDTLKGVRSNIQSANTVLGMLRPSVARALRDDRMELKKNERALVYQVLGSDFDFVKIEDVVHSISPIFRATMNEKNQERRQKRAEARRAARNEPKRIAHLRYLKRKTIKDALAKDAARFGPYNSDALIPVNTIKGTIPQTNVLSDSSFSADIKNMSTLIKEAGGFDADKVVAHTDYSSGAPAPASTSAAERNLEASAQDMFSLLHAYDQTETKTGSLTLNTIKEVEEKAPTLSVTSAANAEATDADEAESGDAAATDETAKAAEGASGAEGEQRPRRRRRLYPKRAKGLSIMKSCEAIKIDAARKQAAKAKATAHDGDLALKNAAKVSMNELLESTSSSLSITPAETAKVPVVPEPLRNRIYEEFNLPPGIQTQKPQRVVLGKPNSSKD